MAKRANGEGSKPRKKPNGRYEARATMTTPTGRRRVSFYGATAKEAAEKRTAAIADRNRGLHFTDPGRLTVGEYLERWLSDSARYQVAESTYGRYRRTCSNHLVPFFGRIKLRDLSRRTSGRSRLAKSSRASIRTPLGLCKAFSQLL